MTTQLAINGQEVVVCKGCGTPRDEATEGYYALQNERCFSCRIDVGEELRECDACEEDILAGDLHEEWFYHSPFDDEEKRSGFSYCMSCLDQGSNDPDGELFRCDGCEREIASDNGRMLHYRILNECELVCLKCLEDDLKAGGIAAIDDDGLLERVFAGDSLFGMFFDVGELEAEGWTVDPDYDDALMSSERAPTLGARCREHHENGLAFIIGYESLGLVGGEGYVTLYTKESV